MTKAGYVESVQSESFGFRAVAIASGKGGVGKTSVVANLAAALAAEGRKVLILDADFGLSNIDVLLGLTPKYHIGHFIQGEMELDEILIEGPMGMTILPAASGLQSLTALTDHQRKRLLRELRRVSSGLDFLFVDTSAGISVNVTALLAESVLPVVVTDSEPTSIVDAYALIKVMERIEPERRMEILVNSVTNEDEARAVFSQLRRVTQQFLSKSIDLFGWVAWDPVVTQAVREQKLVVLDYPECPAACSFRELASKLGRRKVLSQGALLTFPSETPVEVQ